MSRLVMTQGSRRSEFGGLQNGGVRGLRRFERFLLLLRHTSKSLLLRQGHKGFTMNDGTWDSSYLRVSLLALVVGGMLISAAQAQREAEDELFAGLDDAQREQLLVLLAALQDGLAGSYGTPCSASAASDHGHPFEAGCLPTADDRSST